MRLLLCFLTACSAAQPIPDGQTSPLDLADGADLLPRRTVGNCSSLAAVGTWEQITPPTVTLPGPTGCNFGTVSYVLDPTNLATIYLGTCQMGIWKSTDCGGNWVHINTGTNGAKLDHGRQWTFVIDPVDPQILYTNSGYGSDGNGAFKSTNGGVDWQPLWPPADPKLQNIVDYDFVSSVIIDPYNHQHLLLSFHAKCAAPYQGACFGESQDAGATWVLRAGDASWDGGEGQGLYFLDDSKTWLWGSQNNGLWRSDNAGASWTSIDKTIVGHGLGPLYRAKDKSFYLGVNALLHSADGKTWEKLSGPFPNPIAGLVSDGDNIYASVGFPWGLGQNPPPYEPFFVSSESDGKAWTTFTSPKLINGGAMAYDFDHHLLYASNLDAGFWRVVTK